MSLLFLVVEDTGGRVKNLEAAARMVDRDAEVDGYESLVELFNDAQKHGMKKYLEYLAEIDACFVDFDLVTSHVPGYTTMAPLVLNPGMPHEESVTPTTGISALLWLRQVMESSEYRRLRADYVKKHDGALWNPHLSMRIFSFVELRDTVSRLFAAAAKAWFGAEFFNAQVSQDVMAGWLKGPESYQQNFQVSTILDAADELEAMLGQDFMGDARWIPLHQHPSAYDWYLIYAEHDGKLGVRDHFQDAVFKVSNVRITKKVNPYNQYATVATAMQDGVNDFLKVFDRELPDWPEWTTGRRRDDPAAREDPLMSWLVESRLFWTAPDVRVACKEHLRRTREKEEQG